MLNTSPRKCLPRRGPGQACRAPWCPWSPGRTGSGSQALRWWTVSFLSPLRRPRLWALGLCPLGCASLPLDDDCLLRPSSGVASLERGGGGGPLPEHPRSSHGPHHHVPCLPSLLSCEQPETGKSLWNLVSGTPATYKVPPNSCFVIAQMNEEMNEYTFILEFILSKISQTTPNTPLPLPKSHPHRS